MIDLDATRDLDALRFYALYTDRYLVDLFSFERHAGWNSLPASPPANSGGTPDYWLGSVEQLVLLEDGRVSAFVTYVGDDIEDSQPRSGVTYLMIFQQVNGSWRIDRQYENYLDTATQHVHPIADLLDDVATPADWRGRGRRCGRP